MKVAFDFNMKKGKRGADPPTTKNEVSLSLVCIASVSQKQTNKKTF